MGSWERGFQIVEVVVALGVLAALATIGVPPVLRLSVQLRLHLAAEEVVSAMRGARSLAARMGIEVAVKFRQEAGGDASWSVYRDGNGNGVLNRDITSGVDPLVAPPQRLRELGRDLHFGFPPGRPARDPGDPSQLMREGDDPIRFNSSDLASFGPLGTSTPGSVYLTDGRSLLTAVRVYNRTGKVRVITYDFAAETWR